LDPKVFWFVPAIRFEASGGKTILSTRTLPNGLIEYTTRITPYFTDQMRVLVTQNIPEIQNDSQLKPIVAKNIGISLPDFGLKTTMEGGTSYQYLDIPRIFTFRLEPEQAERFDELVSDSYGVAVTFSITYDSVVQDKYYQISVSCNELYQELGHQVGAGGSVDVAKKAHVGASIEAAFRRAIRNNNGGVDVRSKGDLSSMEDSIRQALDYCFLPDFGGRMNDSRYERDGVCPNGDDCLEPKADGEILPKSVLKAKYRFRQERAKDTRQTSINHINVADSVSTAIVVSNLKSVDEPKKSVESNIVVDRSVLVRPKNTSIKPLSTEIFVKPGDQFTIHAEYVVKVAGRTVVLDSRSKNPENGLYFRIGSGDWVPVRGHTTIASDVARGGGELKFYLDYSALYSRFSTHLKLVGASPEFVVQITGIRFEMK
jgi:hypothetical protein